MSTHVVNEFHASPGRGNDVLALLLQLSPESRTRPGCEAISIRRNQDDPKNLIGDTRWASRQHDDDYLAWRTENGYTARFDQMLDEPMLIRYFDEIPSLPSRPRRADHPGRPSLEECWTGATDRGLSNRAPAVSVAETHTGHGVTADAGVAQIRARATSSDRSFSRPGPT